MNDRPKVFIIVLNFNGADFLNSTLKSLGSLSYPNFQVLLVDNNSSDGSLEKARAAFPKMLCLKNSENLGFAYGNNVGIRFALERGADYVLLLNYDVRATKDFLTPLINKMEKDPSVGIASPVIENDAGIWFSGGRLDWMRMSSRHLQDDPKTDRLDSDFITGCAMLVRKDVFKKVGLLDDDFFLYWEDADFSRRAKKAGFKLLVSPESRVWHAEISQLKNDRKIYWLVISGLLFFKKNSPFFFRPWISFYTCLRRLKNTLDRRFRPCLSADNAYEAYRDFNRPRH